MKNEPVVPIKGAAQEYQYAGLTKREYFAAMAMQGILSATHYRTSVIDIPEESVKLADALLKELENEKD